MAKCSRVMRLACACSGSESMMTPSQSKIQARKTGGVYRALWVGGQDGDAARRDLGRDLRSCAACGGGRTRDWGNANLDALSDFDVGRLASGELFDGAT